MFLLRFWSYLSLLNNIGALTLPPLLKLSPRKVGRWCALWSFFLMRLLFVSINLPYGLEYCCHVWAGAPICFLGFLNKAQKRIWRTVGLSPAASLEPLAHRRNKIAQGISIGIILVDVHLNWVNWFLFLSWEVNSLFWQIAWFFCNHS